MTECQRIASQALLRDSICKTYYRYLCDKAIPAYEKENIVDLHDIYHRLDGNHFVDIIYEEMRNWTIAPDDRC